MIYQNTSLSELEKQRVALLEKISEENPPEDSAIRSELQDVENWIEFKKKEQELKASNTAPKKYRFLVGR